MEEIIKDYNTNFNFNKILKFGEYKNMKLRSIGTRYKYMLVIYGVGYYDNNEKLYEKIDKKNYEEIYDSKYSKGLLLQFYREVSLKILVETIQKSILERNINKNNKIIEETKKLENIFLENIHKIEYKDLIHIIWDDGRLYIHHNNNMIGKIDSKELAELIFRCYLDEKTTISNIRSNILNKNVY